MNSLGSLFRVQIFGESHGKALGVIIDGCPPGLPLALEDFATDIDRRRPGKPGTSSRIEPDVPNMTSGVFQGHTTGAPIHISFENTQADSFAYEETWKIPRPGHADFAAWKKSGAWWDWRGGGHFSGRLTLPLVAAGVVAKKLLPSCHINCQIISLGPQGEKVLAMEDVEDDGDSFGAILECRVQGLPAGLGEPFFDTLEGCIAKAVFAIPAIRGIEFGAGFASASMRGSQSNDAISDLDGRTATNNCGGVTGGISNGNPLIFRIAVKPTPSIALAQKSVDLHTGKIVEVCTQGRHDRCLALRVPVVVEAVTAMVLVDAHLMAGVLSPGPWEGKWKY